MIENRYAIMNQKTNKFAVFSYDRGFAEVRYSKDSPLTATLFMTKKDAILALDYHVDFDIYFKIEPKIVYFKITIEEEVEENHNKAMESKDDA